MSRSTPLTIGLTGGVGSGKSTVLELFRRKGAEVLSADLIVHDLLAGDQGLKARIIKKFGQEVFKRGKVDRSALAKKVFRDVMSRLWLEKQIHPLVWKEVHRRIQQTKKNIMVVEVPLLFEKKWNRRFNKTIVVKASLAVQKLRSINKGFKPQDLKNRLKAQWPLSLKCKKADSVIDNDGSLAATRAQTEKIWKQFNEQKS